MQRARARMVRRQLRARGVTDRRVLGAMGAVPRHLFVPPAYARLAYLDRPLPIGHRQTISQPFMVAYMTAILRPQKHHKVLEIGTGSGYQAAVLAKLVKEVYSVEIVKALGLEARARLKRLGFGNVKVRIGDGYKGWPSQAPFDAIILTAAPPRIPKPLKAQLKVGGRMILPLGPVSKVQKLLLLQRTRRGWRRKELMWVRFVPMTGAVQRP